MPFDPTPLGKHVLPTRKEPLSDLEASIMNPLDVDKLSDLAEANGISAEGAHDALEDCILMIELGKIVKEKAPEAWKIFIQGSSKKGNLDILRSEKFCLLGEVLRRNKYVYPIYPCGQNNSNQNQIIVCDLYFIYVGFLAFFLYWSVWSRFSCNAPRSMLEFV